MDKQAVISAVTSELVIQGKLLESGWRAFQILCLEDAPEMQISEMRKAFFLGAEHLFFSIMAMLDPGAEPTEADLEKMEALSKELGAFRDELERSGQS